MVQKLLIALVAGIALAFGVVYAASVSPVSAAPPIDEPGVLITPTLRAFVDPRPRKEAVLTQTHGAAVQNRDVSVAAAPASATWWVYDHFMLSDYQRTFNLIYTSANAYIYADATVSAATAQALGTQFDAVYTSVTTNFGSVPNVDGESRVFLLLTDIRDERFYSPTAGSYVACYFDPAHQHAGATSNLREMLFVDLSPGTPASTTTYRCLAHQLALMVAYNYDTDEETWLDDGLGSLAEYVAGYGHRPEIEDYLAYPDRSLTTWQGNTTDVGQSYLWFLYLRERYGQTKVRQILQNATNGMGSIQAVLGVTPNALMQKWAVANYMDSLSLPDYRYNTLSIVASGADQVTKFTRPPFNDIVIVNNANTTVLNGSLAGPYAVRYASIQRIGGESLQITDSGGQHEAFIYNDGVDVALDWTGVITWEHLSPGTLGVMAIYSAPPPSSNVYQYSIKSYIDLEYIYFPIIRKKR